MSSSRILWFLVDGLPNSLIQRFCKGNLRYPIINELINYGAASALVPAFPNCQTPPSLVSLWSGKPAIEMGVSGYDMPAGNPKYLETISAFNAPIDTSSFIWNLFLANSEYVRLCNTPFVGKSARHPFVRSYTYGFASERQAPKVLTIGSAAHRISVSHIPKNSWSVVKDQETGLSCPTGIWSTDDDTSKIISLGCWDFDAYGADVEELKREMHTFPLICSGLSKLYRKGELGTPLHLGGSGKSERILLSSLRYMGKRYYEEFIFCIKTKDAAFVLGYQPIFDLLLHDVGGILEPSCLHWSVQREKFVSEMVHQLLDDFEKFLENIKCHIDLSDQMIVCSDHGMAPVDTILFINVALAKLGLLVLDVNDRIVVSESACFYHPCENGLLLFNDPVLRSMGTTRILVASSIVNYINPILGQPSNITFRELVANTDPEFTQALFIVPSGVQAKSTIVPWVTEKSVKTGDHGSPNGDGRLNGIVLDINRNVLATNSEEIRTYEVLHTLMPLGRRSIRSSFT